MNKGIMVKALPHAIYRRSFEYARVVSKVHVTSEGVFLEDELPEEYAGSSLDIEVCHAIYMVAADNQLLIWEFENEPAMDKDRKTGGPINRDGEEIREATGDSTVPTEQTTKLNPHLDENRAAIGKSLLASFMLDLAASEEQVDP